MLKKMLMLSLLIIFSFSLVLADVAIGAGTELNKGIPIEPFYGYTYSQIIYLQSEINGAGDITELSWNFAGTSLDASLDWVVYIGHTTKTQFDSNEDWVDVTTLTEVWNGAITDPAAPGLVTIDITDFAYNNVDNLIIAVDENTDSYNSSSDDFYCSAVTNPRAIDYHNDSSNPDPTTPPTAGSGSPRAFIANIILGGITSTDPTGSIAGTVTDGTDPLEGAVVSTGMMSATTAADGTYLIEDVFTGNIDITCTADGFFSAEMNVDVTEGNTTTADFMLNELIGDLTSNAIAVDLVGGMFTHGGTNTVYNNDYPFGGGLDLVFHLTLAEAGIVDADLLGSDYDTKLAIYNDSEEPGADNELYGNDDYTAPGRDVNIKVKEANRDRALQSAIFGMELPAGGYWVLVDGYSASSLGNYELNIVVDGGTDPMPTVFFSEYIEGSSNNKGLEVYNGTDAEISLDNFRINQSNNGGDWQYIHTFPEGAMLAAGDVWVMITDQVDPAFYAAEDADEVLGYPSLVHFNGNDARALEYNTADTTWVIIDVIGIPTSDVNWAVAGVDPGTQNHTIVRKDEVMMGTTDWDAAAGTNADDSEWIVMEENTFSYLGWHIDQPMTPAYISGMVSIDGFGDLTMATVAAGDSMTYVNADGSYMLEVLAGTYDVTASLGGYTPVTVAGIVVTEGATTENVDFALAVIEEALWPPVNLDYTVSGNEVNLSWTAPTQYGWNSYYQGPASLTWAAPERATHFDVTDFGFSYPMELSAISHGFYHHSSYPWGEDTTFMFKIYDADGSTVLYESAVMTALEQWNNTLLELDTAITVTDDFWVSVAVTNTETGFPSSLFSGATTGLHGYVGSPGDWGVAEYDWATEVYVMGDAEPTALAYNGLTTTAAKTDVVRSLPNRVDSALIEDAYTAETRDLVSFNIYRDGVMINADPVTGTTYVDADLAAGSYTYYATAVWNYGESGASNEVTAVLAYGDISGTITDSETGLAIEGAAVTAGVYGAVSGLDGTYTIEDLLVGTYEVNCSMAAYVSPDSMMADVTDGGNTVVDFALDPAVGDLFFFDDFEAGSDNWVLEDTWGLTEEGANSPTHSLTESPNANYATSVNIAATLATPWDLSGVFGATLSFWYQSDIETAFDYMYLEITSDGENWINLATYDEEDGAWQQEEISISGFVGPGFETVTLRFRFESDGGYETVGMLIDDVQVTTSSVDMDPPFILHAGPTFYEGTDEDYMFTAQLVDPSTVASAQVVYTVDGGEEMSADATQGDGNTWNFTIPAQAAGCQVDYKIVATDASTDANTGELGGYVYIAGYHFIYDNGIVDFYTVVNEGISASVKVINPAGTLVDLAYVLIRNYTDQSGQDNNNFMFHVWADDGGLPGADMITPFEVVPEATALNTSPMTRIDLRDYAAELAGITSDFFIGFKVDTGIPEAKVHCTITQPGIWNQSYAEIDGIWSQVLDTDYHFRAVAALAETEFATINGSVTFDGAAVEGASIVAGTYSATTDAAGNYELFVNPGTYSVMISAEGFEDFMQEVTVADGDVATVDAVLIPAFWAPVDLTGTLNGTNAVLQWSAPEAPVEGEVLVEGFETWPPADWTFTDADGDGYQWDDGGALGLLGHTGVGVAFSASYDNTAGALNPDNWLISPAVVLGANTTVNYWVAAQDDAWAGEHYGVYISTTGTDPADFELLFEETMVGRASVKRELPKGSRVQGTWYEKSVDLSAYTGTAYIAFRHFNVTDMFYLDLDDVTIGGTARDTRSLAGYKIYKDGVEIGTTNASTTFFVATGVEGSTEFTVTATYTNPDGESAHSNIWNPVSAPGEVVPMLTTLNANYPNPFNPSTKISFSLREAGNVNIEIFNIKGQKVKTLVNEKMEAANHTLTWNGTDNNDNSVSSGIYFYRMNTKDYKATKKMMLLK